MEVRLEIPDKYALGYDPEQMGRRLKVYAALRMFQSGELSAGAATELAGADRFTFALEYQKHWIAAGPYN